MKVRKSLLVVLALMCAAAFQVNAQTPDVEKAQKVIEQNMKLADKNPKDGKMQLKAALTILNDTLTGKRDLDLALTYANRALKIAKECPAPKDTLLGLTCQTLGFIYMGKQDMDKSIDFLERALDAFEVELGRLDPVTNGSKLIYGWIITGSSPSRGFPKIMEAMFDNERAPQGKRIENMEEANISLEMALEMLMSEQTERFRYALPAIYIDSKRYYILQTAIWNMESPVVGWMVQGMIASGAKENEKDDDTILIDDDGQFRILTDADNDKRQLLFKFNYSMQNRNMLEFNEGEARMLFLNQEYYNNILGKFREFKASKKE